MPAQAQSKCECLEVNRGGGFLTPKRPVIAIQYTTELSGYTYLGIDESVEFGQLMKVSEPHT